MDKIKNIFSLAKQNLIKHFIVWIFCITIITLTSVSYLLPPFGENLDKSTKWLSNITPLVVLIIGYFLKEEISNWHYKKRAEAASQIIGNFRVCSKELVYWIQARCLTPAVGEDAAERKVHLSINKYIESCLEPSAQFPIHIRKDLDEHFEKMKQLANTLSGAITINSTSQRDLIYGKNIALKACEDLQSISSTLTNIQIFLDQKLELYMTK